MENETKCQVQETNEIYETKAIGYESSSTDAQCESRQIVTVKEDDDVDLFTMKEEIGEDEVRLESDLLSASSTDGSGNGAPSHDNLLSEEEKIHKILLDAEVGIEKELENSLVEKLGPCTECGKEFPSRSKLQRHISSVHSDERQTCEICGQKFGSLTGVRKHKQVDHPNILFMCPFKGCESRGFKHNRSLTAHIRSVHAHIRPHVCKTCGKDSSTRLV
ncbi:hypothetical protein KIN20_025459 [Parelaphostrongylus tenuis]|uniref:C2H2-type domain-containing protein n=1 Tax=Parelaphostrongylus tenuis TaxID=148309 RepID=A0AAD5NAT1_PARTN|nr:hypothetical protein KIN20_025459 [Parelaphostrongylus tenuis]